MKQICRCILVCSCLFIVFGCGTMSTIKQKNYLINSALYYDAAFPSYRNFPIETEDDIFAIDEQMRNMVKNQLLSERNIARRAKKLLSHIFANENIALAYQSSANLTAIDTYNNQKANCLSLTIMAYALAKEAELDIKFQEVEIPEYWVRNGQYSLLTGHVNLVITEPISVNKIVLFNSGVIQIDFDPYAVKKYFSKKIISKKTVLAMFYNNKGAQALVEHQYDLAYAYFKQATQVAPSFTSGWANLGILYKLTENITLAENSYRHAISIDKNNLNALSNLVLLLKAEGSSAEVNQIEHLLHNKRLLNPYYHALLADEAYFSGHNKLALKHYKKALKLDDKTHEFYFGIAKVYFQLNQIERAQKAMKKAIRYNNAKSMQERYIAKLNFLNGGFSH